MTPALQNGLALDILAYLVHEMGHALAAIALGVPIAGLVFRPAGLGISRGVVGDWRDGAVTLAGCALNAAVALYALLHGDTWFAAGNVFFLVFNLLPHTGSDGRTFLLWLRGFDLKKIRN